MLVQVQSRLYSFCDSAWLDERAGSHIYALLKGALVPMVQVADSVGVKWSPPSPLLLAAWLALMDELLRLLGMQGDLE